MARRSVERINKTKLCVVIVVVKVVVVVIVVIGFLFILW